MKNIQTNSHLIILIGPTAVGKTNTAIQLASSFNGEIISADSRQVYKGMDIGTDKVSQDIQNTIPHHLIDIRNPKDLYTVSDFVTDANKAIVDIYSRKRIPIITGGTFYYIDTLLGKLPLPDVPPDPVLRQTLEKEDLETLYAKLKASDPDRALNIDKKNKRRLIRALEIVGSKGKVPVNTLNSNPFKTIKIALHRDMEELTRRIRERAVLALKSGIVEETEKLLAEGVSRQRLIDMGFEYQATLSLLDKEIDKNEFLDLLTRKCRRYAKRQITWLKRDQDLLWYHAEDLTAIKNKIGEFLKHT